MTIVQISVTVHEKRNHPYEYGHYDCDVSLTAHLEDADVPELRIEELRIMARSQVLAECDGWRQEVEEDRRIDGLTNRIEGELALIRPESPSNEAHALRAQQLINQMPAMMREEWIGKVMEAMEATPDEGPDDGEEWEPEEDWDEEEDSSENDSHEDNWQPGRLWVP